MSGTDSADAPVPAKTARVAKPKVKLTTEQQRYQDALDRSWEAAQNDPADPGLVELHESSLARINGSTTAETMTAAEFLARTEPSSETGQAQP